MCLFNPAFVVYEALHLGHLNFVGSGLGDRGLGKYTGLTLGADVGLAAGSFMQKVSDKGVMSNFWSTSSTSSLVVSLYETAVRVLSDLCPPPESHNRFYGFMHRPWEIHIRIGVHFS